MGFGQIFIYLEKIYLSMGKLQNMLIGIALGDAFGAGYEFAFRERRQFHDVELSRFTSHPNPEFNKQPGMYTDDTQMSIAVAELLAGDDGFNHLNLAESFVRAYKRDPMVGYAKGFKAFLDSISDGEEFLVKIRPESERNGAAMRAVPIGAVKDLENVVRYGIINANLTHNTPKGIASSIATAVISHYNVYHGRNPDIESELIPVVEDVDYKTAFYLRSISQMNGFEPELLLDSKYKDMGVPCDGMITVGAVIYLLSNFNNPEDILVESVRLGGDTDSVASIALGIHMINQPLKVLPKQLYEGLTNHKFGRDYLLKLGDALEKKYPVHNLLQ
jgi:ADP-ribosyl-[dinitrogen reductase] hydrolase